MLGAAGSSAAGSAQACTSGAARPALMRSSAPSPSGQSGKKRERRMYSVPFPHPLEAPASPEVRVEGPTRRQPVELSLPVRGEDVAWLCTGGGGRQIGAMSWFMSVLWDGDRVPF